MRPEIYALMGNQHGLITRAQCREHGLDDAAIDRLVDTGTWVSQRRGVYATAEHAASLDTWEDRQLLTDRAASLRIHSPHVMSHDSAAHEMRLPILRADRRFTHVTRHGVVGSHIRHGVKHHLAPYSDDQVITVNGRRVLDPARTAVDIAREHGRLAGLVAMDSALRIGVTKAELSAAAAVMRSWPYITTVRECIELADANTDSLIETLGRDLVCELGYGRPQTQFGLTDGRRTAWADLRLHRHLIEPDGLGKYRPVAEGGWARGTADQALADEKKRQDWLCGFKLGMSRVTKDQLVGPARRATLERVRREYLDTCDRFGTDTSDLEPYVVRRPRIPPVERWWPR